MLDREQVVNFVKLERIETVMEDPDQFEYRPEKGWRWLQRLALAALRWIGAHHAPTVVTFRRTARENDDLLKSLLGQERQWIRYIHEERNRMCIYIGPDEEMELMRLSEHMSMHSVTFTGRIDTNQAHDDGRGGSRVIRKWHDIPITVVPWMKGAIIVPRL